MACNSGACQSGCYKEEDSAVRKQSPAAENGGVHRDAIGEGLCIKCKINKNISVTHPAIARGGGDGGRFCADCFRSNIYGKFRFAVTSNAMISPSDNVLLAFSGGSASRVALQFVHEMQQKAQKNFDASRERVLPVFGVGVAYIDETTMYGEASIDFRKAIDEMELIVSNLTPPQKRFFAIPTENIYSPEFAVGADLLKKLDDSVGDLTGKEDLKKYMRMQCLQKAALDNGYTKIVLGTCTSRIACHVLEATVKGQGFSLAADIQYVDARWKVPVVLPLRDCLSEELNMLCSLDSLKTAEAPQQPRACINGLISSFVKLLQEENPSRQSTIVRTAGKLTPFSFNKIPEVGDYNDRLASMRRQKKYNIKPNESLPPESFCFICSSPLKTSDVASPNGFELEDTNGEFYSAACSSCQNQILPKDTSSVKYFLSLLPRSMTTPSKDSTYNHEFLREQIQDCLLSDSDDGN